MSVWYADLIKPPFNPPNWVFGPVWTILYIMIACSIILYLKTPSKHLPTLTIIILLSHLILNFIWMPLFFRLNSLLLSLIDILVLDLTLIVIIFLFWKTSMAAAAFLIPYFLWICLATYLNAGIFLLNRQ